MAVFVADGAGFVGSGDEGDLRSGRDGRVFVDGLPVTDEVVATEGSLGGTTVVGIGPVGVLPEHQRTGIGSALVHAVLAAADALGYPMAALLGDPAYYSRFGFVPGSSVGVVAPDERWSSAFQVRTLATYAGQAGPFRYAAPFDDL